MLGEPALVVRDHRRDPQREALLAEQRVAAVARAVRPDLTGLGEVHDPLLVGVARPRGRRPRPARAVRRASARRARTSPSSPSTSSAAWPARVIVRMLTATYGESVTSTPMYESGEPSGPMLNGTTYIVRPRMEPRNRRASFARISAGSIQLLVGPASTSRSEQMKVRSSTRATSLRVGVGPVGARALGRRRAPRTCPRRPAACRAGRTRRRSRHTSGPTSGSHSSTISSIHANRRWFSVGACTSVTGGSSGPIQGPVSVVAVPSRARTRPCPWIA